MSEAEREQWEAQLRARLNELLERRFGPLASEISSLQATFNSVCTRLIEQARTPVAGEDSGLQEALALRFAEIERRHANELKEAQQRAEAEIERERALRMDERALFNSAIAEIERQRTQAGALTALVDATAQFAPRVVLFVVRGERAVCWQARGLMEEALAAISLPLDSSTLIGDAISKRESIVVDPGAEPSYGAVLEAAGFAAPAQALAVPLVIRGKAAAALYADADRADLLDLQPLEALVRVAGLTIELLPLRRTTEPLSTEAAPPRVLTSRPRVTAEIWRASLLAPSETETAHQNLTPPEPEASEQSTGEQSTSEQSTADASADASVETAPAEGEPVDYAPSPSGLYSTPEPRPEEPDEIRHTAPLMHREAADATSQTSPPVEDEAAEEEATDEGPAYEATAYEIAPAEETTTEEAAVREATDGEATSEEATGEEATGEEAKDEEAKDEEAKDASAPSYRSQHLNARRFARFLVAEIKLYYPAKVAEGLRRSDLYDRLREEIERNRYLYDKHVPAHISAEFDYFYDELVQMLAEGDPEKLGRNCPRPAIAVG